MEYSNIRFGPPYTPEPNSVAGRVKRASQDASRTMLIQATLPTCLCPFAVNHVIHVCDRFLHSATNKTPYSLLMGPIPYSKSILVFECTAIILMENGESKISSTSSKRTLL